MLKVWTRRLKRSRILLVFLSHVRCAEITYGSFSLTEAVYHC